MTVTYISNNPCTLAVDTAWGSTYLEGFRKGLYTQLFFMFFVYFMSQVMHTFKFKNTTVNRSSVQHALIPARISQMNQQTQNPENSDERPDLPWHQKRWNRNFAFMFSSHSVALGMVILFSPLPGAMVVAYIHLLLFLCYCFSELKRQLMATKLLRVGMDMLNLALMIIGAVGIGYAQYCTNSLGVEVCCKDL